MLLFIEKRFEVRLSPNPTLNLLCKYTEVKIAQRLVIIDGA